MKRVMFAGAFLMFFIGGVCRAEAVKEGFENEECLKAWKIDGEVKIVKDQFHSGEKSLLVPVSSSAVWQVSKENKTGTVSFWVYDSRVGLKKGSTYQFGPYFGVVNTDGEKFSLAFEQSKSGRHIWGAYYYLCSTKEYLWTDLAKTSGKIEKGWHKIKIEMPELNTIIFTLDENKPEEIDKEKSLFTKGFSGIIFGAEKDGAETFYYDDIEINFKEAVK